MWVFAGVPDCKTDDTTLFGTRTHTFRQSQTAHRIRKFCLLCADAKLADDSRLRRYDEVLHHAPTTHTNVRTSAELLPAFCCVLQVFTAPVRCVATQASTYAILFVLRSCGLEITGSIERCRDWILKCRYTSIYIDIHR